MSFKKISSNFKYIAFALFGLMLTSCTTYRYEYIAPASEHGKTCAAQCMTTKQVCVNAEQQKAQYGANNCQQQNQMHYQSCVTSAKSQDEVRRCNPHQMYCQANANTYSCDESYRQCFSACGGTVNVYKNE